MSPYNISMNTMKKVPAEITVEIDDGIMSIKSYQVQILAAPPEGSSFQNAFPRPAVTVSSSELGSFSQASGIESHPAQTDSLHSHSGSKFHSSATDGTPSSFTESTSSPKAPFPKFKGSPEFSS